MYNPDRKSEYSLCFLTLLPYAVYHIGKSGIRKEGIPQRIHDLRHTHCVHLLNRWVKEGKDLEALYPYMSEHLGHRHFSDTDYYLTLSKEFYPELEKRMKEINDDILPEVCHAED